jgi:CAAX protease family protein
LDSEKRHLDSPPSRPAREDEGPGSDLRESMADRLPPAEHRSGSLVLIGILFEASLAVVAIAIGWLVAIHPASTFSWSWVDFGWGVVATLPMLVGLAVCVVIPWEPLKRLTVRVEKLIAPLLEESNLIELVAICLVAGIGEELLFRGLLQELVSGWFSGAVAVWIGLLIASLLFGLAHSLSVTYFWIATLIGFYFGAIWLLSDNLLVPITAHGLYDFVAMLYYRRRLQRGVSV